MTPIERIFAGFLLICDGLLNPRNPHSI